MADSIVSVTEHAHRLRWILLLLRDNTLAHHFIAAEDRPSEFALLDIGKILEDAAAAIERRHQMYLQGNGR
jgi:hypothetical protein